MDKKYNDILIELKNKHNKLPNICKIWKLYIENEHKKLINNINYCNELINRLDNDINEKELKYAFLLSCVFNEIT
tara:strand:- start:362 stop:586 length:225 start_codon:yes stop_codon:yes gene_type:complete